MRFHSQNQEARERDARAELEAQEQERDKQRDRDIQWLREARFFAQRSKDPSTKVAAFIVRPDNTLASQGYNGYPKGMKDEPETDRDRKLGKTIHAEMNALLEARERVVGYTMYTTHPTCERCAVHAIQAGIKRVVSIEPSLDLLSRWEKSLQMALDFYKEKGVEVVWISEQSI